MAKKYKLPETEQVFATKRDMNLYRLALKQKDYPGLKKALIKHIGRLPEVTLWSFEFAEKEGISGEIRVIDSLRKILRRRGIDTSLIYHNAEIEAKKQDSYSEKYCQTTRKNYPSIVRVRGY